MRPTSNLRSSSDQNILSTVDYVSLLDNHMGWWYYYLSTVEYVSTLYFFYVLSIFFHFVFYTFLKLRVVAVGIICEKSIPLFINKYKGCVCGVCLARRQSLKEFFFKKKRETTLYLILSRPPIIYWRLLHAV